MMASLYSRLAGQWDQLFPPDHDRVVFVSNLLDGDPAGKRVIEVGCGTGTTARGLADLGCIVAASDLDPQMIDEAVKLRMPAHPDTGTVAFSTDDMINALAKEEGDSAHLILCLGNTLPHLTESGQINRFFSAASEALMTGGKLVVQLLNYPLIVRRGYVDLPELCGDNLIFRRRQVYNRETEMVDFMTEVESRGEVAKMTHNLRPIDVRSLSVPADRSGLKSTGIYMDWNGTAFNGDAPWLVSVWKKRDGNLK